MESMHEVVDELTRKEGNQHMRRALRVAARMGSERRVPRSSVETYLENALRRKAECKMIPCIIIYFVVFSLMLISHENTSDLSQVERNVRGMLEGTSFEGYNTWSAGPISGHKVLQDIDTVDDIYTYLQDAVLPLFVRDLSTTEPDDLNRVLRYNHLIGGLHLQQMRNQVHECAEAYESLGPRNSDGVNPLLGNFSCYLLGTAVDCFGPGRSVEGFCPLIEQDSATKPIVPHRLLSPSSRLAKSRLASNGMRFSNARLDSKQLFDVTFHEHRGLDVARETVRHLKQHKWIDLQTAWVGIRMFLLNVDLGVFCSVTLNIFFSPSGNLIPHVQAVTFLAEPYQSLGIIALDIVFLLLWFHLLIVCVSSLLEAYQSERVHHHFKQYVLNGSNIIEWISLCGGLLMMVLWVVYLSKLTNLTNLVNDALDQHPDSGAGSSQAYLRKVLHLDVSTREFDSFLSAFRIYTGWYTIGLILRFFKAFMAQPRLAVITRTILACAPQLLDFAVIFVVMVMSFTASGMFLFGHRMLTFSTLSLALQSSLQIIIGNFEFEELMDEYPETASIWFFSFIIVLALLMLNMSLAIVMDTYSSMKDHAAALDSIWDQIAGFIDDFRDGGTRISDKHILKAVQNMGLEQVGKNDLLTACPGLSTVQATAIIEKVEGIESKDENVSLSVSDATRLMISIKGVVFKMTQQISSLLHVQSQNCRVKARHRWMASMVGPRAWSSGMRPPKALLSHPCRARIRDVHVRLDALERVANESMSYLVFRSKEAREQILSIENSLTHRRQGSAKMPTPNAKKQARNWAMLHDWPPMASVKREIFRV